MRLNGSYFLQFLPIVSDARVIVPNLQKEKTNAEKPRELVQVVIVRGQTDTDPFLSLWEAVIPLSSQPTQSWCLLTQSLPSIPTATALAETLVNIIWGLCNFLLVLLTATYTNLFYFPFFPEESISCTAISMSLLWPETFIGSLLLAKQSPDSWTR